jgi:hypothetical protein
MAGMDIRLSPSCHPERRLAAAKDLAAAIFPAVMVFLDETAQGP